MANSYALGSPSGAALVTRTSAGRTRDLYESVSSAPWLESAAISSSDGFAAVPELVRKLMPEAMVMTNTFVATTSADKRIKESGLSLPPPPMPFGDYVEAVKVGRLLFLSGMLPVIGREPKFVGRVGSELSTEAGKDAARLACMAGLSVAREYLGSLDQVTAVAKLGVYIAASGEFKDHPKVADGASEILIKAFGSGMLSGRIVLGVASLPLGLPVLIELVLEVAE